MVSPRRATLTVGMAASGLLATAFLSSAIAFADTYNFVPDPNFPEQVTSIGGGLSPFNQEVSGTGVFDVNSNTVGTVGVFDALLKNDTDIFGLNNSEVLVTSDQVTVPLLPPDVLPPVGSVFDTFTMGNGFENVYTDLVGEGTGGANLIADVFDTPFGDFNIPTDFDMAALASFADFAPFG